jgi:(1->4)-alpha-D-glucan 1-alpha-D-glucosylmutase
MRVPVSTYRVQLQPGHGFAAARAALAYLQELGVTDLYVSPFFAAEPGSRHGYNIVDYARLNPELGTPAELEALARELRERGMGLVADFVPNHMGIATSENGWWNDLLENGPSSRFADFFDVDFRPGKASLQDRVLLPILGAQYGEVLERGELQLVRDGGSFVVRYWERVLPVRVKSLVPLLERAGVRSGLDPASPERMELDSTVRALRLLPSPDARAPEDREVRDREREVVRRRLTALFGGSDPLRAAVDTVVAEVNGRPGDPSSFDELDALLREQCYRASSWQVATEEINYRRFFDVHGLAAIRMEDPAVFDAAHALLLRLVAEGLVTGLRLDHTDGLYDPASYFDALQHRLAEATRTPADGEGGRPFWVVAEKILEDGEPLPRSWKVHGTTGYDFTAAVTQVLVDPRSERLLTRLYQRFTREHAAFDAVVTEAKRGILRSSLAAELTMLARRLERIAEGNRRSRDFPLYPLRRALAETLVGFRVYRTYVRPDGRREAGDEGQVRGAIRRGRRAARDLPPQVFDFLGDVLLLADGARFDAERRDRVELAMKFQQLSGPVTAKAVEDTAFYRYHRLIALNEVGCDPARFGMDLETFHASNRQRAEAWPLGMVTTSTHDTKRGEDVRARLAVLTEVPDLWRAAVRRFAHHGRRHVRLVDGETAPSRNDQYLFYQTVVGALPVDTDAVDRRFVERVGAYMQKAIKEAKRETSWVNPNTEYETATALFVEDMLADERFVRVVRSMSDLITRPGVVNGLAQRVLLACAPGVADTYQGSEGWDQRLVDPDNRDPVDFAALNHRLRTLRERMGRDRAALAEALLAEFRTGDVKLFVVYALLQLRRAAAELFLRGSYEPLGGPEHVIAFARRHGSELLVCVVPRWSSRLTGSARAWPLAAAWGEETLQMPADGAWENVLTGERHEVGTHLRLATVFARFPVAVLSRT